MPSAENNATPIDASEARRLADAARPPGPDVSRFLARAYEAIRMAATGGESSALVQFGLMTDAERDEVTRILESPEKGYRVELSGFESYPPPYLISW